MQHHHSVCRLLIHIRNRLDLANDPDVDLVVCSVRVDRHFQTVKPSLVAGKTVYVEWPLDRNAEVARELTALAVKHNAKTIVGLQSGMAPILRKVRDVVKSGAIGRVVSSWYLGSCGNDLHKESHNVRYFLDRDVGGSVMSIHVGHGLETVTTGKLLVCDRGGMRWLTRLRHSAGRVQLIQQLDCHHPTDARHRGHAPRQ